MAIQVRKRWLAVMSTIIAVLSSLLTSYVENVKSDGVADAAGLIVREVSK